MAISIEESRTRSRLHSSNIAVIMYTGQKYQQKIFERRKRSNLAEVQGCC